MNEKNSLGSEIGNINESVIACTITNDFERIFTYQIH